MRFCRGIAVFLGFVLLVGSAHAQSQKETLADIRQELSFLYMEIQRLKTELSTTGNTSVPSGGQATSLERLDALEGELRRLTGKTEKLEFRIDRIVRDGTNRIGDLEFRLVELEGGDVSTLGETTTLGGASDALPRNDGGTSATDTGGDVAVGERVDFDAAKRAFDDGDFAGSAEMFAAFANNYPGGSLTGDAGFWRGEALARLDDWPNAARGFLQSFSSAPDGHLAPRALYRLGVSLERIGQRDEACLTLAEVAKRYPGADAVNDADAEMRALACGG